MKAQSGVAVIIVLIITMLFSIIGAGVLFYTRASSESSYREIRRTKAHYAVEAALQRGIFEASAGLLQPDQKKTWSYGWEGQSPILLEYWMGQPTADGNPVSASISDSEIDKIKIP